MMKSSRYFCKDCNKFFDAPKIYEERHGLDNPPYERIVTCPWCRGSNFCEFETMISKFDVAEVLLGVIVLVNKYIGDLENLYGTNFKNEELDNASGLLNELISDMFEYMDLDVQKKLFKISTKNEADQILMSLRG